MELIFHSDVSEVFEESWKNYVAIIVKYAVSHRSLCKDLKTALRDLDDNSGIGSP